VLGVLQIFGSAGAGNHERAVEYLMVELKKNPTSNPSCRRCLSSGTRRHGISNQAVLYGEIDTR
jgi:hypothetical protein